MHREGEALQQPLSGWKHKLFATKPAEPTCPPHGQVIYITNSKVRRSLKSSISEIKMRSGGGGGGFGDAGNSTQGFINVG